MPLAPHRSWQPWVKREGQEFLKFCPLCSAFSSLLTYNLTLHSSKFSLLQQIYRVTFTLGFYSSNTVQVGEGHFRWFSGLVLCLVPPLSCSKRRSVSHWWETSRVTQACVTSHKAWCHALRVCIRSSHCAL